MKVKLISKTIVDNSYLQELEEEGKTINLNDIERLMVYIARVSSAEQSKDDYVGLIKYCLKNKHWSVFEMSTLCFELQTCRALSPQFLRHKSFSFQEFSQRYSIVTSFEKCEGRAQDPKNRQKSQDSLSQEVKDKWDKIQQKAWDFCYNLYKEALDLGVCKEDARYVLTLSSSTRIYMQGTIRSWIHYLESRDSDVAQSSHQKIAKEIKKIFIFELPVTAKALGWI